MADDRENFFPAINASKPQTRFLVKASVPPDATIEG
jgi:hypothetical protein